MITTMRQWRMSSSAPRLLSILSSALIFLTLTNAQQATILNPAQVPACAIQCPIMLAAQEQCVPPYRPTTNQATYNACFCASDYLTAFKNGQTTGFCDGICSQQELQTLLVWFRGTVCLSQASPNGAATTTAATTTGQPTTTVVNGRTTTIAAAAATGSTSAQRTNTGKGPSWISTNYRWIILIVVLLVAAILAIILGCWWRRRHDRRHRNDPNYRNSMTVANEVALSLGDKHPAMSSTAMSQTPNMRSTTSMPEISSATAITMQQRRFSTSRPNTSNSTWQGGAAGVGAGIAPGASSTAAAAAATAAMRGVNRQPSGSSIGRLHHHQQQSVSDFSPISTPDIGDRYTITPSSVSDRPLLAASPAQSSASPPIPHGTPLSSQQPRRAGSRLQKSNSQRNGGGQQGTISDYV